MEIPEDSANFWRKMFQEPKGIADDPSYHLARLEFNPTEEYEWMGLEITESEIREAIRLMKNDISLGIDKMTKKKSKGWGRKF